VMVSNCIQPGTVSTDPYNHYSLLRSVEDNFGLPHLGYAAQAGLQPFGKDILNRPACPTPCKPHRAHKKKKHKRAAELSKHKKHKHKKKQCKKKKRKKRGKR
jgi:hypothetical protein